MPVQVTQSQVINLYRSLIRESKKIPAYNFRNYALRRIKDGFRDNKGLTDEHLIAKQVAEAQKSLEIVKRQALIGQMYSTDKLVIETISGHKR